MRSIPELDRARRRALAAMPVEADLHDRLFDELRFDALLETRAPAVPVTGFGDALRVLAWNAQRCRDPVAAAALLRTTGAGLLLLSELDHGMARSGQRHTTRELAEQLGLGYAFGVEFLELGLGDAREREALGERENEVGHHGGAVLSTCALGGVALARLERSGRWFDGTLGERRIGGRIAVLARVPVGGTEVAFASVHLENEADPEERALQLEAVFDALDRFAPGAPALVGGDVNSHSLGRAELHDRERLRAALEADPRRLADPIAHEPLFTLAERRGYDWRACNAVGTSTQRRARGDGSARGTLVLDWFFARGLEVSEPAVIEAVDPRTGAALSDHEAIAVTIRCR